ncbi:MAG: hypothetical protein HKN48_03775 [Flavobacteriaceae bacterium]|nr:hypothetical protein [Flavobacteriaceae bacterium]
MKLRLLLFSLFAVTCLFGQQIEWQGSLSAAAQFAGEDQVPFWMQTNNHFRFGPETNFSGLANFNAKHSLSETSNLEFGATFYYRDGVEDEFQRRDLYLQFENRWLRARVGAKANEEVAQGLSVSNKNFLMSGNARPLAGVLLEANDPLKITETFSFDWGIGHYEMNDNRYVEDVKLHHKWLTLITQFNENHKLTAQLQHYVQWGGTSPVFGDLPSDFSAFIKVFFATNSTEVGIEDEIANAVGNHLGAYLLDYEFKTQLGEFSIYHEHPFEDGSGMRLSNLPDGIWGVHFQPKNKKLIKGACMSTSLRTIKVSPRLMERTIILAMVCIEVDGVTKGVF